MAKQVDSAAMVKNFQSGMAAGSGKYIAGVMRVTESPGAAAAAKVNDGTWAANTIAAAPRMAAKLSAMSLQGWQQSVQAYGGSRYSGAAAKAASNYAKVAPQLAQAAAAASQAAQGVSGPLEKVRAAINAFKSAFGRPTI
jgi:hypothetical protein